MNSACGCCEGVEPLTPVSHANRPGLSALAYRAGTHATFLETMLARLSSHALPAPANGGGAGEPPRPLLALRTRETADAAVAFLDALATVADVLTFYQERIANEGYLRTATERLSVIELARLLGYRPRPGVAASVYLAYTLDDGAEATITAGSGAQSTPAAGELPQTFETAEELHARAEWNVFRPRLTRPQSPRASLDAGRPLYLKGTSTNLKPNDPLLVDFGVRDVAPGLFRVVRAEPEQAAARTRVTLLPWASPVTSPAPTSPPSEPVEPPAGVVLRAIVERYRAAADFGVTAGTATARRIFDHLDRLAGGLALDDARLLRLIESVLPPLREEHRLAREGNFTKLEPWIGGLVFELTELLQELTLDVTAPAAVAASAARATFEDEGLLTATANAPPPPARPAAPQPSLLAVVPLLGALAAPPSAQPRSKQQLVKNVAGAFAPTSDNLPRLLGAMLPGVGPALYRAWDAVPVTQPTPAVVYALRTRASVFGHSAPLEQVRDERGVLREQREWTLFRFSGGQVNENFGITLSPSIEVQRNDRGAVVRLSVTVELTDPSGIRPPITSPTVTQPLDSPPFDVVLPAAESGSEAVRVTFSNVPDKSALRGRLQFQFRQRAVTVTLEIREDGEMRVTSLGSNPTVFALRTAFTSPMTGERGRSEIIISGGLRGVVGRAPTEHPNVVSLDATYSRILPGGWAVIERPPTGAAGTVAAPELLIRRIERVGEGSRADYGTTAKGTQLTIGGPGWILPGRDAFDVIRNTSVFAESEPLELAEEPIDPVAEDVCGNRIDLAELVGGLEAGRWMIVAGERTDIRRKARPAQAPAPRALLKDSGADDARRVASPEPAGAATLADAPEDDGGRDDAEREAGVPGVQAAELVMLAGVEQSYDPELPGDRTHTTLHLARPLAYCYKRDTVRVYGNVARATHGETRAEVLGSGDASRAMQSFALRQSPLTYVSAPTTSGVESTLAVRVNGVLWHETETLAGLSPLDRNYFTKTDDDGVTTVVFGNGSEGARPPTGAENIEATYRAGIGRGGNLRAEQINQPTTKPLGVRGVSNPMPATGGADRESRDEARRNAPLAVMALDRLVSARDYEDFARTFAGVAKASASRLSDGRRQLVHLTIAGADDAPISNNSDLYKNLREALRRFGDPSQPFRVDTRYLKTLVVCARVRVHPDYLWEAVEPKVRAALLERFGFDRRDLGQDALLSEAVAAAQSVEGVLYVDIDTFDNIPEGITPADLLNLGSDLGLRARVRASLARVDATALDPAVRLRPAQLAVLTPLVPDTLLLREIKG